MDASRLQIGIPVYRLSPTGSNTYFYDVEVVYGRLKWTVAHRFSDFLLLAAALANEGYDALPPSPPKTLKRPNDIAFLDLRKNVLQNFLYAICQRPDLRNSAAFLEFIDFELQATTVVTSSLLPRLIATLSTSRFRVSDFAYIPRIQPDHVLGSLIVAHEINAHLSRLGKVWSVVEQDELGALELHSIKLDPESTSSNLVKNFQTAQVASSQLPFRVHVFYIYPQTGRIFCGTDTGVVKIFYLIQAPSLHDENDPRKTKNQVQNSGTHTFQNATHGYGHTHTGKSTPNLAFAHYTDIALHQDSVNCLRGDPYDLESDINYSRLLSIGADNTVRIIDCCTLKPISGGKIQKRLTPGEQLTTGILELPLSQKTASVSSELAANASGKHQEPQATCPGSSHLTSQPHEEPRTAKTQLSSHPALKDPSQQNEISDRGIPETADISASRLIVGTNYGHLFVYNCSSYPPKFISDLVLEGSVTTLELAGSTCLVAHCQYLSLVKLHKDRALGISHVEKRLELPWFSPKNGLIRSIAISKDSPCLFLGHSRSISAWDCVTSQCLCVFKAHSGGIRKLSIISVNSSIILVSGSNDGYVKFWAIPPYESFTPWLPPQQQQQSHPTPHWNVTEQQAPGEVNGDDEDDSLLATIISTAIKRD